MVALFLKHETSSDANDTEEDLEPPKVIEPSIVQDGVKL